MLITLVVLLGALVTGEFSWLSSDTSHVTAAQASRLLITPEEPITLTLALVGIGTLAAYFAVGRVVWRRRKALRLEHELTAETAADVDRRSRGAA
jgi:hypothetical protein